MLSPTIATGFPYDSVPDGTVLTSHHFIYATLFALLVCAWVHDGWRNRNPTDPYAVEGGVLLSLFAFIFMWGSNKPALGAILTLVGLAIATGGVLLRVVWQSTYWPKPTILVTVALYAAWDDALQHAFGFTTPLDWLWKHGVSDFVYGLDSALQALTLLP